MKRNWVSISCTHIENSRAWNWKLERKQNKTTCKCRLFLSPSSLLATLLGLLLLLLKAILLASSQNLEMACLCCETAFCLADEA